jgi:O-antigen ligase
MTLKKNFFYFYIFTFWFLLWAAINTLPEEINGIGVSFIKSINALRILLPVIISILSFFFLVKINFLYLINIRNFKFHKIILNSNFLFLTYFFIQVLGIYNNNFSIYNFDSLFLIYLGTGTISIFLLINYYNLEKVLKYLMFFTIFIIVLLTIYISVISFKKSGLTDLTYIYGLILADTLFLNQEMPRITGLSRLWAVVSLFALIIFYNTNNKYIKYFIFIFIILLTTIIWAAQSRGTLICYFLLIIFITLFNIKKVVKKILYIITFIFAPIIIYTLIISTFVISDKNSINFNNSSNVNIFNNSSNVNIYKDVIYKSRVIDNKTSSGRLEIWSDILNKFDKTRFFGYGPQADRNLVGRELTKKFSNNASNLYIYAFACGGYIAVIIFLIINIQIIKNLYQVVFERKLFLSKNNFEVKYSAALLLFFLTRGLIENSYSLFSIDFLLVIISMSIIKNYLKKICKN